MRKNAIDIITDGTPWAITKEAMDQIMAIAKREHNLEAVLKERGTPLDNTRTVEVRGGVALMPINGPLFPRANLFMEISGAVSVEMMAMDLATLEKDPNVKSVVMMFDSPGGRTTMINEFANQIAEFPKPIVAYIVGQASSAAYWLASATDRIFMDAASLAGSIGTVLSMEKNKDGVFEMVSSNAADKRPDINTDAGKAVLQAIVDDLESVFIDAVAGFRAMPREQITAIRGGVLVGAKAVEKGLADEISSLESVINLLQTENPMDLEKLKADHKEIYQAAFNEGKASLDAAALKTEGAKAERERIGAILNHAEAKGREPQAVVMALETDMTAEQAGKLLAASPKAADNTKAGMTEFEKQMAKIGMTNIGAGGDPGNGGEETDEQMAANVVALYNKTTGKGVRK